MRDMAHSICPIKLHQITMRKKFRFFVSDYLKVIKNAKLRELVAKVPKYRKHQTESNGKLPRRFWNPLISMQKVGPKENK